MIDLNSAMVTTIQFFDCSYDVQIGEDEVETLREYSANIVIDESLVIQLSGNQHAAHRASVPSSVECYYDNATMQDWAQQNLDLDDVQKFLDSQEIENNFNYLYQHASDKF